MPDKTVNWGVPGDDARYRTRDDDPAGGGDYVVAETLDANGDPVEVLLRWDDTAGEWVSGGPVNLAGNDVTNVGALDAESVSTRDSIHEPKEKDTPTVVKRPLISTEAKSFVVDPNGSFDAEGTAADPLNLEGLLAKIPLTIQHDFYASFNSGTYSPANATDTPISTVIGDNSLSVTFEGDTDTPSNVVIENGFFNIHIDGRDYLQHVWKGFEFRTFVQPYGVGVSFFDCNFRSSTVPDTQACIGGYSGTVNVERCDFGGNANYAFNHQTGGILAFSDCTGSVDTALIVGSGGDNLSTYRDNGGNSISYPTLRDNNNNEFVNEFSFTDRRGYIVDESPFIGKGDFQPELTLTPLSKSTFGTNSTSYVGNSNLISYRFRDLRSQFPEGADIAVSINGRLDVGTDESADIRLQDKSSGETLIEQTGINSTQFFLEIGPEVIDSSKLNAQAQVELEVRTNPGTNDVVVIRPTVVFGVQV